MESSKAFYSSLKKLAQNVNKVDKSVKFDKIIVSNFSEVMPQVVVEGGFSGVTLDILKEFTSGSTSGQSMLLYQNWKTMFYNRKVESGKPKKGSR